MLISRNILEFINPRIKQIDNNSLIDTMIALGLELEYHKQIYNPHDFKNLVFGKILHFEKVEKSRSLYLCKVGIFNPSKRIFNTEHSYEIICGGDNLEKNGIVIVVLPGQTLPNGLKVESRKIFGIVSHGMICSLDELGIKNSSRHTPDGIFIEKENSELGRNILAGKVCTPIDILNDDLFEVATSFTTHYLQNKVILTNLILWFYDLKRHKKPVYKNEIAKGKYQVQFISEWSSKKISVEEELKNLVTAKLFKTRTSILNKAYDVLDLKIISSLVALGYSLKSRAVNYINLFSYIFGQAMHIYDESVLNEKRITISFLGKKTKLSVLTGKEITLNEDTIVVKRSDGEILAIPSIIGTQKFAATGEEENIYVELTSIDSGKINSTVSSLNVSNITTTMSKKYNSGFFLKQAVHYFFNILSYNVELSKIKIDNLWLKNNLGLKNQKCARLQKILFLLGINWDFTPNITWINLSNSFEWIKDQSDFMQLCYLLILYLGLNSKQKPFKWNEENGALQVDGLKLLLQSHGFSETVVYLLTSSEKANLFNFPEFNFHREEIEVINPINPDHKQVTASLITPMLDVLQRNKNFNEGTVKIYSEIILPISINIFSKRLAIIMNNEGSFNKKDFSQMYSLVLKIIKLYTNDSIIIKKMVNKNQIDRDVNIHNAQTVSINGIIVAVFGEINPILLSKYKNLSGTTYFAEFDLSKLSEFTIKPNYFKRLSKHPNITKDLTFLFPKEENFLLIGDLISSHHLVDDVYVDKIYLDDKGISVTYKISIFQEETISSKKLNEILQALVLLVHSKSKTAVLKGSL